MKRSTVQAAPTAARASRARRGGRDTRGGGRRARGRRRGARGGRRGARRAGRGTCRQGERARERRRAARGRCERVRVRGRARVRRGSRMVVICARAAGCCRCCVVLFVVFCGCSCAAPYCAMPPHSSSLSIGLWVFRLFILESKTDVTSPGWISTNFVPDCYHMCSRCWLLSVLRSSVRVFCGCSCAAPVCAISSHSSSLSIGLWVFQLFILESWTAVASRGWISTNFVPDCCHMCSLCWLLSVLRGSVRCDL